MSLIAITGDITRAKVDAIVNAANPGLMGGGGVDGAIHRAAGSELLEECMKIEPVNGVRCPTGQARITSAGNLDASYVIHTVGPVYHQVSNPEELLVSAYQNSLQLAEQYRCQSIAFPAISCGVYGYPKEEAAKIAVDVCMGYLTHYKIEIVFYLFDDSTRQIWQHAIDCFPA